MRILAVDPGYERLGIAVLEKLPRQKEAALYSGCIRTPKTLPHAERLLKISEEVRNVIDEYEPRALAIETLFLAVNQKTAMPVAEARGAVLVEAARAGLPVYEYTPLQIKIAVTGYGKSDKKQVMEMVKKLVALPSGKRLDDEYDAIAVGLTCLASTNNQRPTTNYK
jgi:crossover junction endodeoxyribonuclease RuvC